MSAVAAQTDRRFRRAHVNWRRDNGNHNGLRALDQAAELFTVNGSWRVDDQYINAGGDTETAIRRVDALDFRAIRFARGKPVEAAMLYIEISECDRIPAIGKKAGNVSGERSLATAAL